MKMNTISYGEVQKLLRYEPKTGKFFWLVMQGRGRAGDIAGSLNNRGYIKIVINRRDFMAHRLAWLLTTGEMPSADIDHINGDRADNRITNLRPATRSQNCRNRGKNSNNTTGFKGVHINRGRYRALICHRGEFIHLGLFDNPEDAHAAYSEAARRLHGRFARVV